MEERVKTSFIPKASLSVERGPARPKGSPVALANIIAGVLLIVAILGSAGIFLFERFTVQLISQKRESLERSRAAFEPATIRELSRLDTRIRIGTELLGSHVALSKLFDELEGLVLSTVRFSGLSFSASSGGEFVMTASGQARNYNAVALQSGGFSKSPVITEPIFSNVNINRDGLIDFDFEALIDTSRLRYTGASAPEPVVPALPPPASIPAP